MKLLRIVTENGETQGYLTEMDYLFTDDINRDGFCLVKGMGWISMYLEVY